MDTTFITWNSRDFLSKPPTKAIHHTLKGGVLSINAPGTTYASDGNDIVFNKWAGTSQSGDQNQSIVMGGGDDHYRAIGFTIPAPGQRVIVYGDEPGLSLAACEGDRFDFGDDTFDVPSARYVVKTGMGDDKVFPHVTPVKPTNADAAEVWMDWRHDKIYFTGDFEITNVRYAKISADGKHALVSELRVEAGTANVLLKLYDTGNRGKLEGFKNDLWVPFDGLKPGIDDVQQLDNDGWILSI